MAISGSVFIATSLDGFIAREDGSLDWLPPGDGEDYGYEAFYSSVDVVVMGRTTYDVCLGFDRWPHAAKRVVVLTRGALTVPEALSASVEISGDPPAALMGRLARSGAHRVYVDGGMTIRSFLAAGLIDDMTITVVPVILGRGIPLFGGLEHTVSLSHVATRAYPGGCVQAQYRVSR